MASTKTNLKGRTVYVVDGGRTPFLRAMGPPGPFHASDLAVQVGRHAIFWRVNPLRQVQLMR